MYSITPDKEDEHPIHINGKTNDSDYQFIYLIQVITQIPTQIIDQIPRNPHQKTSFKIRVLHNHQPLIQGHLATKTLQDNHTKLRSSHPTCISPITRPSQPDTHYTIS